MAQAATAPTASALGRVSKFWWSVELFCCAKNTVLNLQVKLKERTGDHLVSLDPFASIRQTGMGLSEKKNVRLGGSHPTAPLEKPRASFLTQPFPLRSGANCLTSGDARKGY